MMSKKIRVLVVDDNENDLRLLNRLLGQNGYDVVSAGNGVEALEKLKKGPVNLIISNIIMPGMDGFQFCKVCKDDDNLMRIPFVFFTANYTDKKDLEFAMGLGPERVLVKPIETDAFLDTLKTVIEASRNAAPAALEITVNNEEIHQAEYNKCLVKQLEKKIFDLEKEMEVRLQAERHLRVQYYITQVLEESATLVEASSKILQAVCMVLNWDLGEIWEYNQQKEVLYNTEIWHVLSIDVQEFVKLSKETTFPKGIDLPGSIFSRAQPVWIEDVVHGKNFPRASAAAKVGLHGAFGFPIFSGNEVLGTISFYSHEIRKPDKELLNMFASIGTQVGFFIKRKQAEEKIRKLSHAIDYSSASVVVTDTEGKIEYVNPKFTQLTGYSLEKIIGASPRILKSGKTPPENYKKLWETITSGKEWYGEFCNKKKNGEIYWEFASISPIKNDEGVIISFIAVKEDITDRKLKEDELKKYGILFDNISDLAYIFNREGIILFVNKAFEKISGYKSEKLIGKTFLSLFEDANLEKAKDLFSRTLKGENPQKEISFKDTGILCEYKNVPLRNIEGEIIGILGTARDISERKKAESVQREATDLLNNVINSTLDMIFVKDLDLRTIMCNESFAKAVGKKPEELIGKTDIENGWDPELVHGNPEKGIRGFENDDRQVLKGQIVHNPSDPANVGNEIRIFETRKLPLYDTKKRLIGILGVAHDVTDRNNAEGQIKASLKEKNALLMEIHHRVKNNMQIISSLLFFHTGQLKDEQSKRVLKDAQNRIRSMALIHDILYGSCLSNINFSHYVKVLADRLFSSFGIDPDKTVLKININNVFLEVDQAVPLGLLVNELFTNSLKHAFHFDKVRVGPFDSNQEKPEGKQEKNEISISLTPAPYNQTELIVCDNGVGIPKDLDFKNIDSLGLSLINIIAEGQLKGKVTLDRSVKGTKFQIIF